MNRRNFIKSALSTLALALVPISLGIKQADSLSDAIESAQPGDTVHLDSGEYTGWVVMDNALTFTGNGSSVNINHSIDFQDYSF